MGKAERVRGRATRSERGASPSPSPSPLRGSLRGLRREALSPQAGRGEFPHVPTRSGACILRSAANAESAVMRPVFGFSEGMFSIVIENVAESDSTSMVWQLRVTGRVGPDVDRGAVGADAGERQRRRDVDVRRESRPPPRAPCR